jgi:hypothetical protein
MVDRAATSTEKTGGSASAKVCVRPSTHIFSHGSLFPEQKGRRSVLTEATMYPQPERTRHFGRRSEQALGGGHRFQSPVSHPSFCPMIFHWLQSELLKTFHPLHIRPFSWRIEYMTWRLRKPFCVNLLRGTRVPAVVPSSRRVRRLRVFESSVRLSGSSVFVFV